MRLLVLVLAGVIGFVLLVGLGSTSMEYVTPQQIHGADGLPHYALGPAVDVRGDGSFIVYHGGAWGVVFGVDISGGAVFVATLAQTRTDIREFWSQAREILRRQYAVF